MSAKDFIASKGSITDPNIRFLNAGAVRIIPLEDLLDEYLVQVPTRHFAAGVQAANPKKASTKPKKKKA